MTLLEESIKKYSDEYKQFYILEQNEFKVIQIGSCFNFDSELELSYDDEFVNIDRSKSYFFYSSSFDAYKFQDILAQITDLLEKLQLVDHIILLLKRDIKKLKEDIILFDLPKGYSHTLEYLFEINYRKNSLRFTEELLEGCFSLNLQYKKYLKKSKKSIDLNDLQKTFLHRKSEMSSIKVQWKGNDTDLYYLINQLEESGYLTEIDKKNFILLIETNFQDKHGKPFSNKNLTQGINNLLINKDTKSRNSYKIDKIIGKIKADKKENP